METKAISKYLSYILRHDPEDAGITLDESGWTNVPTLLHQLQGRFPGVDMATLEYVVATNSKQRFAFNEDRTMIRASQGHTVNVALNYLPQQPPTVLFHGTSRAFLKQILADGLTRQERHHVHLSQNLVTALQVGQRRQHTIVLKVHAEKMHNDGYVFYLTANNVWLTDHVPPAYIEDEF